MEYLDLCDENGLPTGQIVSRSDAHREGLLHRTAHVWVVREREGRAEILLQKRSREKDSFPGMYDTSSAGHIPAGIEPLPSALRELREELGIDALPEQLDYAGHFHCRYDRVFHGKPFRDNEYIHIYVCREPVDLSALRLQKEEVEEVRWFDLEEVSREIQVSRARICVPSKSLEILREYLKAHSESFIQENDKENRMNSNTKN